MTARDTRIDMELVVDPAGPATLKGTLSTPDGPLFWAIDSQPGSDPPLVVDGGNRVFESIEDFIAYLDQLGAEAGA